MRRSTRAAAMFLCVMLISGLCEACSLAAEAGYFHQVTAVRGRVVGKNLGPLQFRWLRQSVGVSGASLALYEYRRPPKIENLNLIAKVDTNSRGNFDFGPIVEGHYVLIVTVQASDLMSVSLDLEVTNTVKATDSVTIDVSPIKPDCTGGHEFVEKKKS